MKALTIHCNTECVALKPVREAALSLKSRYMSIQNLLFGHIVVVIPKEKAE